MSKEQPLIYPQPNCVELAGYQIWKNRRFERWHQPFLATIGPLNGCFDANCPYPHHADEKLFTDPYARALIDSLSKTKPKLVNNILIQTDQDGLDNTHYVTFDKVITNSEGGEELVFQEHSIPWKDIRYAALIDNPRIEPFSKQGGQLFFRKELACITGANTEEINTAMAKLDTLNWLDDRPVRMKFPVGTLVYRLSRYFDVGIIDEFQRDLDYVSGMSFFDVALTFGIIAQQGRLSRLGSFIPNLIPEKPKQLADGLNQFCEWYLKCVPNSEEVIMNWKKHWANMFKLKF